MVPGTLRPVTFDGRPRATVAAGRDVLSDPVPLAVGAGRVLAVSVHLPSTPRVATVHPVALQTSYLSDRGDFTLTPDAGPFDHRISSWPVLTALDVLQPHPTNAVVAIGDSITDGFGSKVNADQRWTDALERRLAAEGGSASMAVLNAGLSANQLLVDDPQRGGTSPAARFERDVAAAAGVTDVVLHIGTNDIAAGRSAAEITAGLQRFAELARGAGLRVFLSTITPSRTEAHGTRTAVATRNAVNDWIRAHGREHADGVLDFAKAVADRTEPTRLAAAYDSGDGLHLSAAGYGRWPPRSTSTRSPGARAGPPTRRARCCWSPAADRGQPTSSKPASNTAAASSVDPTSRSASTVTAPLASSTSTPLTPGMSPISSVTDIAQC